MGQIDKNLKNELFKVAIDYIYKEHLVGSQGELAEKIGISASALSRIMNDKKFVGDDTLRKMNEAFGGIFNMAYFRGEDPHCMLMEDLAYYKQHPKRGLCLIKRKKLLLHHSSKRCQTTFKDFLKRPSGCQHATNCWSGSAKNLSVSCVRLNLIMTLSSKNSESRKSLMIPWLLNSRFPALRMKA